MAEKSHKRDFIQFGSMAPDSGLYTNADTEVAMRQGCALYSGQPLLIPKIRKILAGTTTGAATFDINGTSNSLDRFFFSNGEPKLWEWDPIDPTDSGITDRTPAGTFEDVRHNFGKWGDYYLCIPETRGTANRSKLWDPGAGAVFVDMISSGLQVLGKHFGRVKEHLIIANAWDSVNGTEEDRFNWCARGDVQSWTTGTNEAGFAYMRPEPQGNAIEDLATWNEFALFFTRTAVVRLAYQGGAQKWDPQQIGKAHQTVTGKSAISVGRDCFYLGIDGPRVVVAGEECVALGRGRVNRQLMDRSNSEWALSKIIDYGYDKSVGSVYWIYESEDGHWRVLMYQIEEQEFLFLDLGVAATQKWGAAGSFDQWPWGPAAGPGIPTHLDRDPPANIGTQVFFDQSVPLSSVVLIPDSTESAGDWRLWAQHRDDGSSGVDYETYSPSITSKIQRFHPGRSEILEMRPVYRTNAAAAALDLTITVEWSDSLDFDSPTSETFDTAEADQQGRIREGLPGAHGFFHRFTVSFPEVSQPSLGSSPSATDFQSLLELSALEVITRGIGDNP